MTDPFEEEQQMNEGTNSVADAPKQRKSWAEIKAAYWKSPWYSNFKFVHWKDVVIFLLAVILILNMWTMHNEYGDRAENPCKYCPLYKPVGGAEWSMGNGTFTLTNVSNSELPVTETN